MKIRYILIFFLSFFMFFFLADVALAEDLVGEERESTKRDETAYDLMSYSDESWYEIGDKTTYKTASAIKDLLWMTNIVIAKIVLMVVYQLFSLDIVNMTKDGIEAMTSSTAGALVANLGLFAFAVASIGIVFRSYVQQNWGAFFKLLLMVMLSMSLLFSMQSKKLNYIDFAHGLSTTIENAILSVNPSLNGDKKYYFKSFDDNTARSISVSIENKVFNALIYKPYLMLQYGTTNEKAITKNDPNRITDYLDADPKTEEGAKKRKEIAENEYKEYKNQNIFAGNGWKQSGYIIVLIISAVVQGFVFFAIALLRVMLQFGFILMLIIAPIMLFMSLFPTFELVIGRYIKGLFLVILFKAMTIFIVLIATSFISLGYDMTDASDDIYYRIFVQIIFGIAVIFMYAKRHFLLNMFDGATPTVNDMGGDMVKNLKNPVRQSSKKMMRNVLPFKNNRSQQRNLSEGNKGKMTAVRGKTASVGGVIGSKLRNAKNHIASVQMGEVPNMGNPYAIGKQNESIKSQNVEGIKTGSDLRNAKNHIASVQMEEVPKNMGNSNSIEKQNESIKPQNKGIKEVSENNKSSFRSRLRDAKNYIAAVQMGEESKRKSSSQAPTNLTRQTSNQQYSNFREVQQQSKARQPMRTIQNNNQTRKTRAVDQYRGVRDQYKGVRNGGNEQ